MKKKAKTIDGLHWPFDTKWRYLHMFLCKMTALLRVTFQACKSSTVPQQHHTLERSTVWTFSLVVRCRTRREKRPFREKIPKNITKAERPSCSVTITKVCVPRKSMKYRKFDQNWSNKLQIVTHVVLFLDRVTTGHPRLMEMPADHFSADPFPILPRRDWGGIYARFYGFAAQSCSRQNRYRQARLPLKGVGEDSH